MYLLPDDEVQTNFPVWSEKARPVISWHSMYMLLVRLEGESIGVGRGASMAAAATAA